MPTHAGLTGEDLHEPKGAESAPAGSIYKADGSGSGQWTGEGYALSGVIDDISTASEVLVAIPYGGRVVKVSTVLQGPITVADAVVTFSNSFDAEMTSLTISNAGSDTGDVDSADVVTNNSFSSGDFAKVATDGGSTDAQKLWFSIYIERTS